MNMKSYENYFKIMRGYILLLFVFGSNFSYSQPMSGDYSVGGNSPDFTTLQSAAHSLFVNGMSGPVNINVRPGTYFKESSPGPVLVLDSVITGLSSTNRLTFQSDVSTGGNVDNVILQIDCDSLTNYNSDREIVYLHIDYTTFRNLTLKDADSLGAPARWLIRIEPLWPKPTVDGIEIDGCKFIGTPYYDQGNNGEFGTNYGIEGSNISQALVTDCQFKNLNGGVILNTYSATMGSVIIENNRFRNLFPISSNTGAVNGGAVYTNFASTIIRKNFVSNSTGRNGIQSEHPVTGVIEANYITGNFWSGQLFIEGYNVTDSLLVKNNIIIGGATYGSMYVQTRNTKLLHNTIDNISGSGVTLYVSGAQCSVINNIILDFNTGTTFGIASTAIDVISDHNVFYRSETIGSFAQVAGTYYATFDDYRLATGKDFNSNFTDVEFEFDSLGIHLDECQAQDSRLNGIPLPDVPVDYYGALRDLVKPFVGAVEGVRLPFDMFGEPFRAGLQGFATSIAQGKFDNSSAPGIAVPDYDNSAVYLFHNNGAVRNFNQYQTIYPAFQPTVVEFFDLDADGNLDLVIGGEASELEVWWGNGAGGFSGPTSVPTNGRVRAIHAGHVSFQNLNTVVFTEDNGFLPNTSFVGYIDNSNGRNLITDLVTKHTSQGDFPDTIYSVLQDFTVNDLDGNGSDEIGAIANAPLPEFYVFSDTSFGNFPWGHHYFFSSGSGSYTNGAIVADDFNGDGNNDFITTGTNDNNIVFLRNQGALSFSIDTIRTEASRGLVNLDYENDGDPDFVTINNTLDSVGITVFLNDGSGNFEVKRNCFLPFASGQPFGVVEADFDEDGMTDIAMVSRSFGPLDSIFVLYNLGGFNQTTDIGVPQPVVVPPENFSLSQNYPNPFNPTTTIEFSIPKTELTNLVVYNILGEQVKTLLDEEKPPGNYSIQFNARSLASGIYFYRLHAGSFVETKKMLLLK